MKMNYAVMRHSVITLLCLASTTFGIPPGGKVRRVSDRPFSLNQDTPAGNYSRWVGHDAPKSGELITQFRMKESRGNDKWSPFIAFELGMPGTRGQIVRVLFDYSVTHFSQLVVIAKDHGRFDKQLDVECAPNVPVDLTLRWTGNQFVELSINHGETVKVPLPFTPEEIRILSGSANFDINNVQITSLDTQQ